MGEVRELNPDGRLVWSVSGYERLASAQRLPNGSTLIATDAKGVVVVDRHKRVVRQVQNLTNNRAKVPRSLRDSAMLPSNLEVSYGGQPSLALPARVRRFSITVASPGGRLDKGHSPEPGKCLFSQESRVLRI